MDLLNTVEGTGRRAAGPDGDPGYRELVDPFRIAHEEGAS